MKSPDHGSVGFIGLLTIVFITLKLCKVIGWPWLWVLSPVWITSGVYGVMFLLLGIVTYWKLKLTKQLEEKIISKKNGGVI